MNFFDPVQVCDETAPPRPPERLRSAAIRPWLLSLIAALMITVGSASKAGAQQIRITLKCEPAKGEPATTSEQKRAKPEKAKSDPKLAKPRFEPPRRESESAVAQQESFSSGSSLALGCTGQAFITVEGPGMPPNSTVVFNVTQSNPANILALRWTNNDPYTTTLQVPVQLNSSGFGQSNLFQVKGTATGNTILQGFHATGTTTQLLVQVVECACPTIFQTLPPR